MNWSGRKVLVTGAGKRLTAPGAEVRANLAACRPDQYVV